MATTVVKSFLEAPHFDDFDETKNYHRVLFRPGHAVQARELTQLQTALQAQIDRYGQFAFKDGSRVVNGKATLNVNYDFVKVESSFTHSSQGPLNTDNYLDEFVGSTITGTTTGVTAIVKQAVAAVSGGDPATLYLQYTAAGTEATVASAVSNSTSVTLSAANTLIKVGQKVTGTGISGTVTVSAISGTTLTLSSNQTIANSTVLTFTGTSQTFANGEELTSDTSTTSGIVRHAKSLASSSTGLGSSINIEEGVYFIAGTFVFVPAGSLLLDKYTNTPSYIVGLKVTESKIDSSTDTTLLDNAQGVPNAAAPGALRYQISTTLIKEPLSLASRTEDNYITLLVIENGLTAVDKTDKNTETELTERLARRTFEESGDYVVEPFQINLKEYLKTGDNFGFKTVSEIEAEESLSTADATTFGDNRFQVGIDPSVAYVKGFRVANGITKQLTVEKPRGASSTNTVNVSTTSVLVGNFVKLTAATVKGMPDVNEFSTIDLHSVNIAGTQSNSNKIGTARARALEFVNNELRLYLFDINMTGSNVFSSVKSVNQTGNTQNFIGDLASIGNLFDVGNNGLIFKLPQTAVKTLRTGATTTDTVYIVKQLFDVNSNTISVSNATFVNTSSIVASLGNGVIDTSPTISSGSDGSTSLTFSDISGATPNTARMKVMADVQKNIVEKTKTRVNGSTVTGALSSGALSLAKSDIIRVTEVKDAQNVVITDRFILDNGQRDNFYQNGKVSLKPGNPTPSGNITVTFDHYTHTSGDYFSVDSYPEADRLKKVLFDSNQGEVNLLDCLDFRPRKADAGADNFTGTNGSHPQPPKPNHAAIAQVEHFMPRIDKVYITRKGEFKTEVGVPSLTPKAPKTPDDSMAIYNLFLNPFVYDLDDVSPKIIENRRYSMKDIGDLDSRIKNLEYYTSLSLLEQSAADVELFDGSGFSRLKNGFIVDGFKGHNVGDTANPDYTASIDKKNGILRPKFDERNVNLVRLSSEANGNGSNNFATKSASLVTLPFTETNYVNQPYSSFFSNVNPYNVFTWGGMMDLSPDSDEWKETDVRPNVIIDDSAAYEQFAQLAEESGILGTVWNEWETNWTGVEVDSSQTSSGAGFFDDFFDLDFGDGRFDPLLRGRRRRRGGRGNVTTITTTTTTQNQSRSGLRTDLAFDTVQRSDGQRVVEINFVPFIRSRKIHFKAQLMKPNTTVFAFFDGVNVANYVQEESFVEFSDSTGVKTFEGLDENSSEITPGALTTDAAGIVEGSFIIPRNAAFRFPTGVREFRLSDDSTNNKDNETTYAEAQYHAQGLIESVESRIVSTKVPTLVTTELNDDRTIVDTNVSERTEWVDPLAETILIDREGGIFAKSVDLFFKKKDTSIPVRVTIRTTQNGIPTQRIVPGADKILYPTSVNISDDASAATNFAFDYPVYLSQDTEYAIVITSQCDNYEVAVAEMGGFDLTNLGERITKQPYGGVFFSSQNASTWTPEQSKDLKFKLNRCSFSTASKTLTLVNDAIPARRLPGNPLTTTQNSGVITVTHKNHGMYGGGTNKVVIAGATDTNGIAAANINGTHTIANITHDTYTITAANSDVSTNSSAGAGAGGGSAVTATENRHMDVMYPVIQNIQIPGTSIRFHLTSKTNKSINGSETAYSNISEFEILPNKNFSFSSPRVIASAANETQNLSGAKSFQIRCVLSTSDEAHSPVIDLNRTSVHTIQNIISSNGGAENVASGGAELARYITKKVELNEEADSATVFLNVNRPAASNVDLYFRVLEGGSNADISDVAFTALSPVEAIPVNENSFSEIRYDLTESILSNKSYGTIQFKIVLRSTSTSNVPKIKDFRAICAT
tara:strand:- start:3730 stop:9225 length:5496 start_codon:yes stop_codon:yes gene_type:complete